MTWNFFRSALPSVGSTAIRISGALCNSRVTGKTVTEQSASNRSD